MDVKRNGHGFSEEQSPFEETPSAIMSAGMPRNARDLFALTQKDNAEIGHIHTQYQAFYAVLELWRRRKAEGMTQKDIAVKLGRDPAWVSRTLSGPKNWTLRTLGELTYALGGEVEVKAVAREDVVQPDEDVYDRFGIDTGARSGRKRVRRKD